MTTNFFFGGMRVLVAGTAVMALIACGGGDEGGTGGTGGSSTTSSGSSTTTPTSGSGTTTPTSGSGTTTPTSGSGTTTPTSGSGTPTSAATGGGSTAAPGMVDDMEDGDTAILEAGSRKGYWYTYNDETTGATQTPSPFAMTLLTTPRETSKYAASTKGSGFTVWGSGMGFDLNASGTTKSGYDASSATGISFWAMAATGSDTALRVNLQDKNTAPEGGVCTKCNDHFGANVTLTTEWKQYTFTWKDLTQQSFGDPQPGIDAKALYAIQFQMGAKATYEYFIDDIAFTQ